MRSFRDIKSAARQALHGIMEVPAYYITDRDDPDTFLEVTVRPHTKFKPLGNLSGTDSAEIEAITPRIIFMRDQVPMPEVNAIVSIAPGEAYYVDAAKEPDGISITATVVPMTLEETVGLPIRDV